MPGRGESNAKALEKGGAKQPPEEETEQLRGQYKKLHLAVKVDQVEESFSSFRKVAGGPFEEETEQLLGQYKKLRAGFEVDQVEESFSSFRKVAGDKLVKIYLADLEKFYNNFPKINPSKLAEYWDLFIERDLNSQSLAKRLSFVDNEDLIDRAIKLAFLRNYPQYYDKPDISIAMMHQAVDAESESDARRILEASPKHTSSSAVSDGVIKKGDSSPFLRFDKIVKPMLETLDQYAKAWQSIRYLSPYVALIGPSMSGKSRSLVEMAQHVCVVYVCLRPSDSKAYPPRSALADHILSDTSYDLTSHYSTIIAAIFRVVANFFNNQNSTEKKEDRLNKWNDYTEVASRGNLDWSLRTQQRFTNDVLAEMEKLAMRRVCSDDFFRHAVKAMSESTEFINKRSSLRVLLVLDEARELLRSPKPTKESSFFLTLRRVLGQTASNQGFFAILVDTTFHVPNFSIATKFDPSARHGFVGPNKLYPPIYEIASLDAMVGPEPPRSWAELMSLERLSKYGSPIFGAYFRDALADGQSPAKIYEAILELAHFKLLGPDPTRPEHLTRAQAFAFLGPTIQPRINGAYHLNTELIASHAAHVNYISPAYDKVMSNYPSQFTLAAAAVKFLTDDDSLIDCIKALTTFVLHGLDSAGGAGELASRIILLRAMQDALDSSRQNGFAYGRPVRLVDFLIALTGVRKEEDLDLGSIDPDQRKDLLDHGMIFWNHFSFIKYSPSSKDLLQFLYRSMAVQCKPKQPGLDQLFTIYLTRDSGELKENNISFCGIQVKNHETGKDIDLETGNHKWTDSHANVAISEENPYLIISMGLQSTKSGTSTLPLLRAIPTRRMPAKDPRDRRQASVVFHGLDQFACLSQEVIAALKELINTEPDVVQLVTKESGKLYTKIVNPCVYSAE